MNDEARHVDRYSGRELVDLTEELRQRFVARTLFLALVLCFAAAPLIVVAGIEVQWRLVLLTALTVLCGLAFSQCERCYEVAKNHPSSVLPAAVVAAAVLAAGGGRQNPTFVVIVAVIVGLPVAAGLRAGLAAGMLVAAGYLLGILARKQSLLVDGSPGDIAAIVTMLVGVYAAHAAAGLASLMVADFNREARLALELTARGETELARVDSKDLEPRNRRREVSSVPPRLAEYGVTLAEAQVALLSADGESQREIAAYLRKSSRTVENQLASVRRKLDAPTASAMAAIVARAVDLPAHGPSKGEAPESAPGSDR